MKTTQIGLLCLGGLFGIGAPGSAAPYENGTKPAPTVDEVTVVYRGSAREFTGQDAKNISKVGARLLTTSRTIRNLPENAGQRQHFETARNRSCVIIRFAQPRSVRQTCADTAVINVEKLVIPFSPDLDPESVFALSGPRVAMLADFQVSPCDDLRSMLVHAGIYPASPGAVVKGVIQVTGKPPVPRVWQVDPAIKRVFGLERYQEETWLVGPENGLRNCVVMLREKDPDRRLLPRPMAPVSIDKDMVRYDPRVLVVTPDTPITLQNADSPCRGFKISGSRQLAGNDFNYLIAEGTEKTIRLKGPDICSVNCPVRPYAQGYIHVVDTPYFALSDSDGRFTIRGVPDGEYDVTVWHEVIGRLTKDCGPTRVTARNRGEYSLNFKVAIPAGGRE